MKFFDYLSKSDKQNYNEIIDTIRQIRIFLNERLDLILEQVNRIADKTNIIYSKIKFDDNLNEAFNIINHSPFQEYFYKFLQKDSEFKIKVEQNELLFEKFSKFQNLFYSQSNHILKNLYCYMKQQIHILEETLQFKHNKIDEIQLQQASIIRHSEPKKTNKQAFSTYDFEYNQGIAESFYCLKKIRLDGIYLAQLFEGNNDIKINQDDFNKQKKIEFRIHDGLDLEQTIYYEEINIVDKIMEKEEERYKLILNQPVYLFKGLTYTITLISKEPNKFKTLIFSNSKPMNQEFVKFLRNELEFIQQPLQVKNDSKQSPFTGMIISKC